MAHAKKKFDEYFGKMALYNTIAADNNVSLKQVLLKKPEIDEELADALIERFNTTQ